jgi:hypothetical protein
MRPFALLCLALAHLAMGFEVSPNLMTRRGPHKPTDLPFSCTPGSSSTPTKATPSTSTSLFVVNPFLFSPEVIGPVLLILAAAAATILAPDNVDEGIPVQYIPPPPEPAPIVEPPAPAPVVAATIPLPTPPPVEVKPALPDLFAYKEDDVKVQEDPSIARTARASTGIGADVAAFASKSAGERLAELRRGVAKSLDDSSNLPTTQLLQRSAPADDPHEKEIIRELIGKDSKKKRNLGQKILRVVKKVVAPWRKWENIQ